MHYNITDELFQLDSVTPMHHFGITVINDLIEESDEIIFATLKTLSPRVRLLPNITEVMIIDDDRGKLR